MSARASLAVVERPVRDREIAEVPRGKRGQRQAMVSNGFEVGVDLALDFLQTVVAFERVTNVGVARWLRRPEIARAVRRARVKKWTRPLAPKTTTTERLVAERLHAIAPTTKLEKLSSEDLEAMKQAIFKGAFQMFEAMLKAFGDTQRERHLRKTVRRWMDGIAVPGDRQRKRVEIARALNLGNESSVRRLERRNTARKATMLEDIEPRVLRRRTKTAV